VVRDWNRYNLTPPPRGYRWLCYQNGNCFLVRTSTGVIRESRWRDERDYYWRKRYSRQYTYNDDIYYRECRDRPDPAGVLIGGLIGGLLGQAVGRDDGPGAAFAGIIIGSIVGGALSRDLDCDDRGYAYRAYYVGLNSGRPGIYRWRNPRNRHRGEFLVRRYYYDNYGFRCASYRHSIWADRYRYGDGRACRQPDGAWAFLD
jgi:surface antigen